MNRLKESSVGVEVRGVTREGKLCGLLFADDIAVTVSTKAEVRQSIVV